MTTTTTTADRQALAVFLSTQSGTAAEKILSTWADDINAAHTAKEIMDATGLSRTTVNTNLNKLAQNGGVIRLDADKVTTWSLTPTRKAALKRAAKKAAPKTTTATRRTKATPATVNAVKSLKGKASVTDTTNEAPEAAEAPTRTATGRRARGAIDAEIIAYFAENTDPAGAGSYAVANAIGSSKGAAYVALRRMTREGTMTLVSSEPDRYFPAS